MNPTGSPAENTSSTPATPPAIPLYRVVRVYRLPSGDEWEQTDDRSGREWAVAQQADVAEANEPARYWTPERIFFTVLIIITLLSFLAYTFSGLFTGGQTPAPPPTQMIPMV